MPNSARPAVLRPTPRPPVFGAVLLVGLVSILQAGIGDDQPVIVPKETIILFNGRDLSPFYSWEPRFGHSDPDRVFSVVENIDGAPAIRISGEHDGSLITRRRYAHYKIVAEFRRGLLTWSPRRNLARNSGILVYCRGEDGAVNKTLDAPWLCSVEFQIREGCTGDFILVPGYRRGSEEVVRPKLTITAAPGTRRWSPDGKPTEFDRGQLDWRHHDPAFKDVTGFRGPRDVERPLGEWNRVEGYCDGPHLTYILNGVKVNEGTNCSFEEGKLLLESEGSEIYFRRVELQALSR